MIPFSQVKRLVRAALPRATVLLCLCLGQAAERPFAQSPAVSRASANSSGAGQYATELDPQSAAARFHKVAGESRAMQRRLLAQAADSLSKEFKGHGTDSEPSGASQVAVQAGQGIIDTLRESTDFSTALLLCLQLRSQLPAESQARLSALIDELSQSLVQYRQDKLAYQTYLGERLQAGWQNMALSEKRARLGQYFALTDESPDWLLIPRPSMIDLPLTTTAKLDFQQFEAKVGDLLSVAERGFQTERTKIVAQLNAVRNDGTPREQQLAAVADLHQLLQSDYGRGFRGMMLCEVDTALPLLLQQSVSEMLKRYQAALALLKSQHAAELRQLRMVLEPARSRHLELREFGPLIAIDMQLEEAKLLFKPLRIFAYRPALPQSPQSHNKFPAAKFANSDSKNNDSKLSDSKLSDLRIDVSVDPEDALLIEHSNGRYHVRFLSDRHEAWLPRAAVLLKPTSGMLRDQLRLPVPADGPGEAVSQSTRLEGAAVCISGNGWQPVTVVDVSPFGAVIHWYGAYEGHTQIQPRSHLRVLREK